MLSRFAIALTLCLLVSGTASAQVVRFETTVGDFDMVLNPTHNPLLQAHVDNMLQYVENDRYLASWINRADTGFVLQMGGFYSHTRRPPPTIESIREVRTFEPVQGEPASTISGLSNTVGMVSLALSGNSQGTNQDSGTSSFFVNLTSNTFLDADFTVFAAIPDMTVVNQIMGLTKIDRTTEPQFEADPGNLAFTDVPVESNGFQVFIKRAFVVEDAMSIAQAMAGIQSAIQLSSDTASDSANSLSAPAPISPGTNLVPEPAAALVAVTGILAMLGGVRRRRRCVVS